MYRRFFSCLHLAVGRHHRRRTPRYPHGLQLGRVKVFLADHTHTRSWIYHKLSFFPLFYWGNRQYTFFREWVECSFVLFFEPDNVLMVLYFPAYLLTWRRLGESYSSNWARLCEIPVIPSLLRDTTQLWYSFHNSYSIFVFAFSSFVGMVALFRLFILLLSTLWWWNRHLSPALRPVSVS